jgi:hypothetical protein
MRIYTRAHAHMHTHTALMQSYLKSDYLQPHGLRLLVVKCYNAKVKE